MTLYEYTEFIDKQAENEVFESSDFQSDITGGFPTRICWNGKQVWLILADFGDDFREKYVKYCADYGVRNCCSIDVYNSIVNELGADAVDMCYLTEEYDKPFLEETYGFELI